MSGRRIKVNLGNLDEDTVITVTVAHTVNTINAAADMLSAISDLLYTHEDVEMKKKRPHVKEIIADCIGEVFELEEVDVFDTLMVAECLVKAALACLTHAKKEYTQLAIELLKESESIDNELKD